jgi:hypothetical protein
MIIYESRFVENVQYNNVETVINHKMTKKKIKRKIQFLQQKARRLEKQKRLM